MKWLLIPNHASNQKSYFHKRLGKTLQVSGKVIIRFSSEKPKAIRKRPAQK